jgi:hypothetical protein
LNPDPIEYHVEHHPEDDASHRFYYHDLNRTPPTHEKPHFDAYEIEYSNNGEYAENYTGSGYFKNANGEDVPFNRQMGIWGPNGMRRFHLYNRIALLERSRNGEDIDFLRPIQLRLAADGTPFDISIDLTEEKNHARFIENESDELFLFEESLQNEKRELRLAKLRQYEAELRQRQEDEALFQRRRQQKKEKDEKMIQFKNRASQKKSKNKDEKRNFLKFRWLDGQTSMLRHTLTIQRHLKWLKNFRRHSNHSFTEIFPFLSLFLMNTETLFRLSMTMMKMNK